MSGFANDIIQWFLKAGRDLPWRHTRNPYSIWISEVILQQTRVQQGLDYYHRFLQRFPDPQSLALASEEEVLSLWQGLGYYSRARNLQAAARFIHFELNGIFPANYRDLQQLKGVGSYTAAAIASFAFGENVPVVDGNVLRVFCRFFGIANDIRLPATQEKVRQLAAELLPAGKSWEFNQAIMELGALVCTPAKPDCPACPLASGCQARSKGLQSELPFKSKAKARRHRFFNYLWLECDGYFAFRRRDKSDIWEGLFEPLLTESDRPFLCLEDYGNSGIQLPDSKDSAQMLPPEKCILSHQEIHIQICLVSLQKRPETDGIRWVAREELESLPKPVIFSKIIRKARSSALYLIL